MATHDYPISLIPQTMDWASIKSGVQFRSPFNGAVEGIEFPGERWALSITLPMRNARLGGQPEAYFARLAGGVERVRLWHFLRPQPAGTMRGSPTLSANVARGAQSLQIATTGTLEAGDFFKIGGQLFQVFLRCAPVEGVLTVPLVQRVHVALNAGAAVQWDRPTALFVVPAMSSRAGYSPGAMAGIAVDLEEVPA